MKKILLTCCGFLCLQLVKAQEKPSGYYTSVLSRYDYRGWVIRKGDALNLKSGDVVTVKEIQKYKDAYDWKYYVKGKNKEGKEVWYDIAGALEEGNLLLPGSVSLKDKVSFGILPSANGKILYEYIGEQPGYKQDKIFSRILSRFARMVSNNADAIQVQITDKEEGHIMVRGGFVLSYGRVLDLSGLKEMRVSYICEVWIKDGRYKLSLSDFRQQMCSSSHKWECYPVFMEAISNSGQQRDKDVTLQFDGHNKMFIQNFVQALNTAPDTNNW